MSPSIKRSVLKHCLSQFDLLKKPRALLVCLLAIIGIGTAAFSVAAPASGVWAVAFSPTFGATIYLGHVTCTSTSDCWVVGYYDNSGAVQTAIEHWNGTEWAFVTSPNIGTMQNNRLFGVACASVSDCWAVGDYGYKVPGDLTGYRTLIEHWDGDAWRIVTSPNTTPAQGNHLFAVTCVSASDCWAAGHYYNGEGDLPLVEHWNGNAWTIVISPDPGHYNYLNAITCASASDCWAVGAATNDGNFFQTLIAHWDGAAWRIVTSPDTGLTDDDQLFDVTCASASDCWAVGSSRPYTDIVYQTLIEHWNGTAWTIIASPHTGYERLLGVTCASASDCWAVGYYYNDTVGQPLIEHWNGTAWTIIGSPHNSPAGQSLVGVTCASASDCWAVGYYPLIAHYSTSNKLDNISTRLNVKTGENVAIAGFIISGQPQKVFIRALGPTLASPPFNVSGTLGDPKLVLYDHTQSPIASNDNWPNTVIDGTVITQDQENAIYSSGYRPSSNNESVISAALPAGSYTAIVSGVNNTTGVALVEVYDLTPSDLGSLTNISTRGSVQTGANVMIGGFIVSGAGSRTVVVRGLGPTLTGFGVSGALGDPTLELRDANANLLALNDNWKDSQQAQIQTTGFAPPNDLEPAILATLPPANYTAILRGKNNTSGVALIETYVTN